MLTTSIVSLMFSDDLVYYMHLIKFAVPK